MHSFIRKFLPIADIVFFPFVVAGSFVLLAVRKAGIGGMRLSRAALMKIGVFPVIDHYYEPFFSRRHLRMPLDEDRALPGIDMNVSEQLAILKKLTFGSELAALRLEKRENLAYYYENETWPRRRRVLLQHDQAAQTKEDH